MRSRPAVFIFAIALMTASAAKAQPVEETPPTSAATDAPSAEPAVPAAPARSQAQSLTILFTTDLYGRFSPVDCDKPPTVTFANMVGALDAVREEQARAGLPAPLVLNGGDNIGPRAFARFVLSQKDGGGAKLAGWMKRAGYEYIALGNQDFYATLRRLTAYLTASREAGLVFGAANLDCEDREAGLCPLLDTGPDRYRMIERAGLKIAVFSVIHADLAETVQASHLKGIKVASPYARAREVTERARAAGADLVIALSHLDRSETAPRKTLKLARKVPDLDLIIANAFTDEGERGIDTIRFADGSSPIVGCDLFGEHLCRTDLNVARAEGRWRIAAVDNREIATDQTEPDAELKSALAAEHQAYCDAWDQPVGEAKLAKPMSADDFQAYLMEVMRNSTRSELGFTNRGLVNDRAGFPLEGTLTRHDFFTALPHRNRLYTFELTDKGIIGLCAKLAKEKIESGTTELLSRGLDCGDPANKVPIKVNGRVLETSTHYTAVTIEYLATGVYGYFDPKALKLELYKPDEDRSAPILGKVVRDHLRSPDYTGPQAKAIDLEANFPDLARELRWVFDGGLNVSVADTAIGNSDAYEESQLTRKEFTAIKAELRGSIGAGSSLHAFSLDALLKYARSNTEGQGGWIESEDLTTINALYKLNALRDANSGWYVPAPYLEAKAETELTRPKDEDEGRDYHHLEITGTLGARFPLAATLEAKIGFGVRDEVFDETTDPTYGFDLGYKLKRTNLFNILGSPLQMESELGVFFGDVGRDNTLKGTWTNRLYFALIGPIFFSITHDLFVYRFSERGYGWASDLTFGLSYNARTTVQTY